MRIIKKKKGGGDNYIIIIAMKTETWHLWERFMIYGIILNSTEYGKETSVW